MIVYAVTKNSCTMGVGGNTSSNSGATVILNCDVSMMMIPLVGWMDGSGVLSIYNETKYIFRALLAS